MNKIFFILIFSIGFAAKSFPQEEKIIDRDSLEALSKLAFDYLKKYNYQEAIESSLLLIEEAEKAQNDYYHYHAHNFLGIAYEELRDTLRAKKNYTYALKFAEEIQNDTLLLWANNNLGNVYSEDKATASVGIAYYNKVIELAEKLGDEKESITPRINIGWTYMDNGSYSKAFPYLKQSLELLGDDDDNYTRSQLYMLLGKYHTKSKDFEEARSYFERAVDIVEEDSLVLQAALVYREYADMLFEAKDYEAAYTALEKHTGYESEIFEKDRLQQIEAANARFEISEYQKNLELAKREQSFQGQVIEKSREKMAVLVISSIVMFMILLILYRTSRSRRVLISELEEKNDELRQAKEKAEKLSASKTRFFSTVSHELRTPLYGVIGLTSLLLEDKSLQKHASDLRSLKFSADYLLALINDVLQMNKMESDLVKLEEISFSLHDLMYSIVKSFEFTRLQNKNEIYLEINGEMPSSLKGDPVRLSQILMNLTGNAMKFTERGKIYLSASLEGVRDGKHLIRFEIKDNGIGIPKSKQALIFEEFSQLRSANYSYQGTGLGLPIVKKLLELFDSEIQLESEEGKGSAFSFTVGFEAAQKEKEKIDTIVSELVDQASSRKILIVDDNRINQVVTRRILEKKEFKCEVAESGVEAIEKVKAGAYDLVLMDVNMPGITGLEATRQIRQFNKNLPVVALTAVEIQEIREEIFEAGMNDIIVKPYDVQQFYQIIYRNLDVQLTEELPA